MALKDWKKSKFNKDWYNNFNDNELWIEKISLPKSYEEKYIVQVEDTDYGHIKVKEYFKTILDALKFAKSYMRTH